MYARSTDGPGPKQRWQIATRRLRTAHAIYGNARTTTKKYPQRVTHRESETDREIDGC